MLQVECYYWCHSDDGGILTVMLNVVCSMMNVTTGVIQTTRPFGGRKHRLKSCEGRNLISVPIWAMRFKLNTPGLISGGTAVKSGEYAIGGVKGNEFVNGSYGYFGLPNP